MKVYIINLKDREDRKKEMIKIFNSFSKNLFDYKFIEATNRTNKSIKEGLIKLNKKGFLNNFSKQYQRKMFSENEKIMKKTRGIIANFISHMRIWYKIGTSEKNKKWSLILEDDAFPTDNFNIFFKPFMTKIKKYNVPFVYLGDCFRTKYSHKFMKSSINKILMKKSRKKSRNNRLLPRYTECLHAYLVSTEFCREFVKNIDQFFPISKPSDNFINEYFYNNKIPFYTFDKSLFDQNLTFGTDIQFTGDDKIKS